MSWLLHWVFYAFPWISRWAWGSLASLFSLIHISDPVDCQDWLWTLCMVELFLLLNGKLSLLSPRKRQRHFYSSSLGIFLTAAVLKLSQNAKCWPYSWQKYIASKGQVRVRNWHCTQLSWSFAGFPADDCPLHLSLYYCNVYKHYPERCNGNVTALFWKDVFLIQLCLLTKNCERMWNTVSFRWVA